MKDEEINKQEDIEAIDPKVKIPINQYDLNGRFIKTFDDISEAASETGITTSEITMCLINVVKSAGGYQWRKVE